MTASALSALTPEQQRQRIAEVCGWRQSKCPCGCSKEGWMQEGDLVVINEQSLPDSLNDLNAIAGAEQTLTQEQQHHYITHLVEQTHGRRYPDEVSVWQLLHATALQRAHAFLLTIN